MRSDSCLASSATQPADHVAGAQIVASDARDDAPQVLAAIDARLEDQLGGVGAGEDRAERLVDLVGDRSRQLAGDRQARGVREFGALLLHRHLGPATATSLEQQRGDEPRPAAGRRRR